MNVEDLLLSKNIKYIPKGADFVISCLNPEHPDRNPSMRVDQITGIFNCFSCEYKGNLFTHFGEKANQLQLRRQLLKKKIGEKRAESVGLSFPKDAMPYVGNWRDISPQTYAKFEAFQHGDSDFVNRINFPIRDLSGKIVGFQGRHTAGGVPKYKFSPPGIKLPLFPRVTPHHGEVILVEGLFDVLNLHDKGLDNAICCFGTHNVNEDKLNILRMQNTQRVAIFFDGDEAGQKAAENIKGMCEKIDLNSRNVCLDGMDPGALTRSQVDSLTEKLYA